MKLCPIQKKLAAVILIVSYMHLLIGCSRFYRPITINTAGTEKQAALKQLTADNKYFIIRKGANSYTLSNVILNEENMTMTGGLSEVPPEHKIYLKARGTKYRYHKSKHEDVVLTEVHLYTGDTSRLDTTGSYSLALSDVQRIEVIEFDQRRTTSSFVWGSIGAALGVGLVVAIIAAATYEPPAPSTTSVSSCPYISSYDGKNYILQGEVYSAAIYPSLQKEDYLPLVVTPVNGSYQVKISNELKEIQHTDLADLLVVEHDSTTKILIDQGGKAHAVSALQPPSSAILNNHADVSGQILSKDNASCYFKDFNGQGSKEEIYLSFEKDVNCTSGKLILNAKTSSWVNYLYGEFSKGFGGYYNEWVKKQEKKTAVELEKWSDEQNIPLSISIKTNSGWKEVKKIKTIGPILHRELAVPLELPASKMVELKLSTGFMFWELDFAAMDFSKDPEISIRKIKPYEAINEHGVDVLQEITYADKKYINQPNVGDFTVLRYRSLEAKPGMTQTFFLHTSGYYTPIRAYTGTPKIAYLKSFRKRGAFPAFSQQKYAELLKSFPTAKK